MEGIFKKLWQRFADFAKGERAAKGGRSTTFLLALACIGIVLMFFSASPEQQRTPPPLDSNSEAVLNPFGLKGDYRERLEGELEDRLRQVKGVKAVSVLITLESGSATKYAQNTENTERSTTERDEAGGQREIKETTERKQLVMTRDGSGEQAVVTEERQPKIKGVLIVARGAENLLIKERITIAVAAALDLPTHRISVLPMD
ncbi:MAG: stage III sporulation protein AG [Dethiobacter sp.]|nr:stage III sporulation protein AG [Dethiobacter sp.]MBS3901962.1 stage III sporulation protein AG [Dethiobacter sp.]MBS3988970.1 stage III sporulation protein AG [Dethiobacter sp.]